MSAARFSMWRACSRWLHAVGLSCVVDMLVLSADGWTPPELRLSFVLASGRAWDWNARPAYRILELARRVSELSKIPLRELDLSVDGMVLLQWARTLEDYNIHDGAIVFAVRHVGEFELCVVAFMWFAGRCGRPEHVSS